MSRSGRCLLLILALVGARPASATTEGPARVLLLDSFGQRFAPYSVVASTFRTELARLSPRPVEFLEVSLETVRFEHMDDAPLVDYVRGLCGRRRFDLVVTNGAPAAQFWLKYREVVLPNVPSLIAAIDERPLSNLSLTAGDAVVSVRIDVVDVLRRFLEIRPETKEVVVVVGNSPLETFWRDEIARAWKPFESRVRIRYFTNMTLEETLRRSVTLPASSAIFFDMLQVDSAGVPYDQNVVVDRLHAVASAPLFSWSDNYMGHGIVGGPLMPLDEVGRSAARAAQRLLAGEPAATVTTAAVTAGRPMYDWRELNRWRIPTDRLPPGRDILFRPPSLLREYRWPILASVVIIAAQALAIALLLVARRRRLQAVHEAARLRGELAHAGRVSTVGQLASSLAHELNQPLGAILRNAEAADLFLAADPPNLDEVRAILADIRKDDQRAGGVIDGIRDLLRRHETSMGPVRLETVVESVATLVGPDARSRRVTLAIESPRDLPDVKGDPVQLQQVLLNLVINGMEAIDGRSDGRRMVSVEARHDGNGHVEMSVSDSGPGVSPEDLPRIFDNFYTTKANGMGMGLAICRRIVEAHGGRIDVENGAGGGATFRVSLPVAGRAA